MSLLQQLFQTRASAQTGGSPQTPAYWVQKLFGGGTSTTAGVDITEDTALTYSPVWAAVSIISGAIGFLPVIVYKRNADERDRAPAHPAYKLLHTRANPYMSAQDFQETLQAHVLLWGNAYAEIERDGAGRPIHLWPLLPHQTEPVETPDGQPALVTNVDGRQITIRGENTLHIKGLGFNGFKGYSVISYAAEGLSLGMAADKFGAAFFANGTRLSGVLEHPATLSDTAHRRLTESIEDTNTGLTNQHRVKILEEGMEWKQMSTPPNDAQFIETSKFRISDVARWFSIPPHMLGDLERATFSNIEHQGIEFVRMTLQRWLTKWESEINYKLFSAEGRRTYYAEFLIDALLRGDTASRYAAYNTGIQSGWLLRNEARRLENLNPVDGLDEPLQPSNMIVVGEDPDNQNQNDDPASPPPDDPPKTDNARFLPILRDTWDRIIRREVNSLRRQAKSGAIVFDTAEYRAFAFRALEPIFQSMGRTDASDIALRYVTAHNKAIDTEAERLLATDAVTELLQLWLDTEPENLAQLCIQEQEAHV
jgi:HK97 family phage portal protein